MPTNGLREAAREAARARLLDVLRHHNGNVSHAARELGMDSPGRVYAALARHGYQTRAQRDRLLSELRGGAHVRTTCDCGQ